MAAGSGVGRRRRRDVDATATRARRGDDRLPAGHVTSLQRPEPEPADEEPDEAGDGDERRYDDTEDEHPLDHSNARISSFRHASTSTSVKLAADLYTTAMKKRSERRKHCAPAAVPP